jgi:phage terminase large subunit GpA-like protein
MLISEWATQNIVLEKGTTPRPGPYVPEVFQRIMMDAICDPKTRRVTIIKSTQVGYTQLIFAICCYFIACDPSPIGFYFPRDADAKEKSKTMLAPMIANCEALRTRVRENKSRKGGNTQQLKEFPGGFLKIAGSNSGASLRSASFRVLIKDEVDGWLLEVPGEGDPNNIVERRTDAYPDEAKIIEGSTPAKPKGLSPTENGYLAGDQTMFHVPCPHCGHYQPLLWRDPETKEYNMVWYKDADGAPIPDTVAYRCQSCRQDFDERSKQKMLDSIKEVSKYPHRRSHRSFYINAMYSPWGEVWPAMAKEWHEATGNPEKMRAFVNLRLGETWDEGADAIEPTALLARREEYAPENDPNVRVPSGVAVLICTVDVQQNRLEAQITGFGVGEEQWLIDHEVFYGSPLDLPTQRGNEDLVNVWTELDAYILRGWKHASGAVLRPSITLIDTGYAADACYNFIMPRQSAARRVYASRGQDRLSKIGLVQEGTVKNHVIRLFNVATYACKDRILARLKVNKRGPSYQHFPKWTTEDYFDQLTAESKVPRKNKTTGRVRYEWVPNQLRNEALDLTVYAHAGLWILQKLIDPTTYNDLAALSAAVEAGGNPTTLRRPVQRRIVSQGVQ